MVVIKWFVKNEYRYNEIMKFEFKLEISDFENHWPGLKFHEK